MKVVQKATLVLLSAMNFVGWGQTNDPRRSFARAIEGKLLMVSEDWESRDPWRREQRWWSARTEPLGVGTYSVLHCYTDRTRTSDGERRASYGFSVGLGGSRRTFMADPP